MQWGVCEPGDVPGGIVVHALRFQCQRCRAVVMVAPRGVLPSHRYTAVSIALSLALWSVEQEAGHEIRQRVSPLPSSGYDTLHGWRSLGRWARRGTRIFDLRAGPSGPARALALDITRKLAALAVSPSGPLVIDACAGALRA